MPGADIVLAVSGGPDSVAMAGLFRLLERRGGPRVAWAHLNHRLRGPESDADQRFVRALSRRWGTPLLARRADVASFARREGRTLEEAGRILRYRFLEKAARRTGARLVATAHTADDQAATVLMRLERGAGLRGLSAIPESRPIREGSAIRLIRPLLSIRRRDLAGWLRARGVPFRIDATNDDMLFHRNRVRRQVLEPWERSDPRIVERLCALAEASRRLRGIARPAAAEALSRVVREAGGLALGATAYRRLSPALGREALRDALERAGIVGVTRLHLSRLDGFLRSGAAGRSLSFPGGRWRMSGGDARWEGGAPAAAEPAPAPRVIRRPGAYRWGGWRLDLRDPPFPVTVRARRPGDRIRLPGGMRTVSDLLIDRKIPRELRDLLPVIVRGSEVLEVAGVAKATGRGSPSTTRRPSASAGRGSGL